MEDFVNILIPAALTFGFLRLCVLPMKWIWKLGVNSLCGFACLWLLNLISGFTGIFFPINPVTVLVTGFLGLPGIALLAVSQFIL